jgi:hypothetical protein
MEQHRLKNEEVIRVPSEEAIRNLVALQKKLSAGRIYLNLLKEGFSAYRTAMAGRELDENGSVVKQGFLWVILESLKVIVLRVAAMEVALFITLLTTILILLSPAISLIHLPFILVDIKRKQKAADAEGKASDAELREKVESALRDSA